MVTGCSRSPRLFRPGSPGHHHLNTRHSLSFSVEAPQALLTPPGIVGAPTSCGDGLWYGSVSFVLLYKDYFPSISALKTGFVEFSTVLQGRERSLRSYGELLCWSVARTMIRGFGGFVIFELSEDRMAGAPRVRSMNIVGLEARPVLGPAGNNKAKSAAKKPASKPTRKAGEAKKVVASAPTLTTDPAVDSPPLSPALSAPTVLRRQELLLHPNLSLNASCSSDASTDSFRSRASTGRIGRPGSGGRWKHSGLKPEKIAAKLEKIVQDGGAMPQPEAPPGKRRCAWVTPNTEPCYAAFHDGEWGVPVHDDKQLFELLVLSSALAELTWPAILGKRHIFREVFMDFDPVAVSKLNEKKIISPGSTASSLLSEPKLRAIIENSRQILKVVEEFGSFDRYCWGFVNHKPITNRFRYPRQVPVKSPKADVISKDLVKRGFRCVGPTVIYSFMQVAGITNDHLISCFRFEECAHKATPAVSAELDAAVVNTNLQKAETKIGAIDLELSKAVNGLSISLQNGF